jgi:hypothetical protein
MVNFVIGAHSRRKFPPARSSRILAQCSTQADQLHASVGGQILCGLPKE